MAVRGYGQTVEKPTLKNMRFSTVDCLSLAVIVCWCTTLFCSSVVEVQIANHRR